MQIIAYILVRTLYVSENLEKAKSNFVNEMHNQITHLSSARAIKNNPTAIPK